MSRKRTSSVSEKVQEENIYIITLYHHKENLDYFYKYFIEQMKTVSNFFKCGKIILQIISSNPNLFMTPYNPKKQNTPFHHLSGDIDKLNNFLISYNINIFEHDKLTFHLYEILPFESELLKLVLSDTHFTDDINKYIDDTTNVSHNSIGTKRFFAQKLIYDEIKKTQNQFFHLQIDYGTVLGIPEFHINKLFQNCDLQKNLKANYYLHLLTNELLISNETLDISLRQKIQYSYCEESFCIINDVNVANYDVLLFLIYYNNRSLYIDHMGITEPQVSKNECSYYNNEGKRAKQIARKTISDSKYKFLCLGPNCDKERSGTTMIPKMSMSRTKKSLNVVLGGHYNKFYITNMNVTFKMNLSYDPFKQYHWEDVDFTYKMIKNGLIILPFWLYTWTICKKQNSIIQPFQTIKPQDCTFMKYNQTTYPKIEIYGDVGKDVNITILNGGDLHPLSEQCSLTLKSSQNSTYGDLDNFLYNDIEKPKFKIFSLGKTMICSYIEKYHYYNNNNNLNIKNIVVLCVNKLDYICKQFESNYNCELLNFEGFDTVKFEKYTDFISNYDIKFNIFIKKYCVVYLLDRLKKTNYEYIKYLSKKDKFNLQDLTNEILIDKFSYFFSNLRFNIHDDLKNMIKSILDNVAFSGGEYDYMKYKKYQNKNISDAEKNQVLL